MLEKINEYKTLYKTRVLYAWLIHEYPFRKTRGLLIFLSTEDAFVSAIVRGNHTKFVLLCFISKKKMKEELYRKI